MPSWQSKMMKMIFRIRRVLKSPSTILDVTASRVETDALAAQFKTKLDLNCTPVDAGGVAAEWVIPPRAGPDLVILYLHGGSYNSGSIQSHRPLAANIANSALARALIIDYRLAPENPFPAAVEDALIAYRWLLSNGHPPGQVIVVGDSAGGGLALASLVSLRDQGEPLPLACVCLSPWTDLTCEGESWSSNLKKDILLIPNQLKQSALLYLAGADPFNPLASPLYADLNDLPPLLIQVGSEELILSDATGLAEHAQSAGVAVTLEIWDGMQHEWHFTASLVPEARHAIASIGVFIGSLTP